MDTACRVRVHSACQYPFPISMPRFIIYNISSFLGKLKSTSLSTLNHFEEFIFVDDFDAEGIGFFEFCGAHVFAGENIVGFL